MPPAEVLISGAKYVAVYENEGQVREFEPDLFRLAGLHPLRTVVTAPGEDVDFVSRYFAPGLGVPEDPVSGSNRSIVVPFWTVRLGRNRL